MELSGVGLTTPLGSTSTAEVCGRCKWRTALGGVLDFDIKEAVQDAIFSEVHRKRYNLAEEAPICQGTLCGQFGYTATSPTARSILDGMNDFPPDMDDATRELFEEIAHICSKVPLELAVSSRKNAGNSGGRR
jgi:hypothetical protein